jgi:hypothetical protein
MKTDGGRRECHMIVSTCLQTVATLATYATAYCGIQADALELLVGPCEKMIVQQPASSQTRITCLLIGLRLVWWSRTLQPLLTHVSFQFSGAKFQLGHTSAGT